MTGHELRDEVRYEVMRAGIDRRYGLWAAVLAVLPRAEGITAVEARRATSEAIQQLLSEGYLYVFRAPRAWGDEELLVASDLQEAIEDDRNWRPRKTNTRRLARLGATATGAEAFLSGAFGNPAPMTRAPFPGPETLEIQPFTWAEAISLLLAVCGFFGGLYLGSLINMRPRLSFLSAFLMFALGICGLAVAILVWRRLNPGLATGREIASDPHYIPDAYMDGPSLNPLDELGNQRF
ncbi:MAG: hypothetical protein H0W86_10960 [Armatimonadetes bacterium]|nr:hypothetical protein [Armatimonadota bacterium]